MGVGVGYGAGLPGSRGDSWGNEATDNQLPNAPMTQALQSLHPTSSECCLESTLWAIECLHYSIGFELTDIGKNIATCLKIPNFCL